MNALIRKNARNTEIVTFSDKRLRPVHVVRGGTVVAAVSIAVPGSPAQRPIRVAVQVVSFAIPWMQPVTVLRGAPVARLDLFAARAPNPGGFALFGAARAADLDRVAFAVDGAEFGSRRRSGDVAAGARRTAGADAGVGGSGDRFGRWRPL